MSLTAILACCVLGCDFLIYAFFQWVYREKGRERFRKNAAPNQVKNRRADQARLAQSYGLANSARTLAPRK
jgi:hypothetical protein